MYHPVIPCVVVLPHVLDELDTAQVAVTVHPAIMQLVNFAIAFGRIRGAEEATVTTGILTSIYQLLGVQMHRDLKDDIERIHAMFDGNNAWQSTLSEDHESVTIREAK